MQPKTIDQISLDGSRDHLQPYMIRKQNHKLVSKIRVCGLLFARLI